MKTVDLCPGCLIELADDYAFDHVAIDRVLAGDRDLFKAMKTAERLEVLLTAFTRGLTIKTLAEAIEWPYAWLQGLLPAEHPQSRESYLADAEQQIRDLYGRGQSDATIAAKTGINPTQIGRLRKKLGLPTRRRSSKQIRQEWAA